MMTAIIIFIVPLVTTLFVSSTESQTMCGDKCCANYYKKDGRCQACAIGSFRLKDDVDDTCLHCKHPFYGQNCLKICACSENESCHHADGCICKQGFYNCTQPKDKKPETTANSTKSVVPVLAVVFLVSLLILLGIINRWLCIKYNEFRNKSSGQHKGSFIQHCLQTRVSCNRDEEDIFPGHDPDGGNPYCYIRESAMIKMPEERISSKEEYNHLNRVAEFETYISASYHGNCYITSKDIVNGRKNIASLPHYDRMEIVKHEKRDQL